MGLNDYLQRVQVGRHKEVPVETLTSLWFIFYNEKGEWDSATMTQWRELVPLLKNEIKEIFAVWHGQHRTNLFLMDKADLIKRLQTLDKDKQNQQNSKEEVVK